MTSDAHAPRPASRVRSGVVALAFMLAVAGASVIHAPAVSASSLVRTTSAQSPGPQLPLPEPSTSESDQTADDILAKPEYRPPPKSLLERIMEWVGEQWSKLTSSVGGGASIIVFVIIAALLLLVVYLVARVRGVGRFRPDREGYEFDLEDQRPPAEWVKDAERFEADGKWKEALRCRFRALVGELIDLGAVRDVPGRTIGEYRLELRSFASDAMPSFGAAAQLFEAAWYGDEPTGQAENAQFRAHAEQTIGAVRATAKRRADRVAETEQLVDVGAPR